MKSLFQSLPEFPPAMPDDELRLLARLPDYGDLQCVTEVYDDEHAACRRLERKKMVKVHREKMDDIAIRPTWFAGVLPTARLRRAQ